MAVNPLSVGCELDLLVRLSRAVPGTAGRTARNVLQVIERRVVEPAGYRRERRAGFSDGRDF